MYLAYLRNFIASTNVAVVANAVAPFQRTKESSVFGVGLQCA